MVYGPWSRVGCVKRSLVSIDDRMVKRVRDKMLDERCSDTVDIVFFCRRSVNRHFESHSPPDGIIGHGLWSMVKGWLRQTVVGQCNWPHGQAGPAQDAG